ncbi:uncharacterized protein N7515_005781 [Penicillium bovifimosum]|uniref:AAA+ ATPase domain-containing protein n=1 Tax=Penicillium bovifimosum TaxID=126998 RepID=A0A9W9GTM1_9EURO|nr:uncharacterized protein N7515_005781 [Penicillium bovifimosum]KAJ5129742.1 hypothetical protein N7515_005781 [Penicillium bovifimosum]
MYHPFRPHDEYMPVPVPNPIPNPVPNPIPNDMTGGRRPREPASPSASGEPAAGPRPVLAYTPGKTEGESRRDHHRQLLAQQLNQQRHDIKRLQGSTQPVRPSGPNTSFPPSMPPGMVNNPSWYMSTAPGPAPYTPYPPVPAYPVNPPHPPARYASGDSSPSPAAEEMYARNPEYPNAVRSTMYTPPSQGSVSVSEANDLKAQITALQNKVRELEGKPAMTTASRYQILYRIEKDNTYPSNHWSFSDSEDEFNHQNRPAHVRESRSRSTSWSPWMGIYTDPPELIHRDSGAPYLRCNDPLLNFELYLALNKEISFVVFRNYKRRVTWSTSERGKYSKPEPFSESILAVSGSLKDAIENLLSGREFWSMRQEFQSKAEIHSPYLCVYHNRGAREAEIRQNLSSEAQRQLDLFRDYVELTRGNEYAAADSLLKKGKISAPYVPYLFKPNDLLVSFKNKEHVGYVARDWPVREQHDHDTSPSWSIRGQGWGFSGEFYKFLTDLRFEMPESHLLKDGGSMDDDLGQLPAHSGSDKEAEKEHAITDLAVYPIKYASADLCRTLERRGETFWKFRKQQYVSYQATEEENFQTMTHEGYMIDMKTYQRLHAGPTLNVNSFQGTRANTLDERAMARESPPPYPFSMLMPPRVIGFNLRLKQWIGLSVDRIWPMSWNKAAFENLAINPKSKDLIEAMVTNHLEPNYSADVIGGKGNGLIMLLHGGPGTGKTLTAESVAEIAEKPLYRVTCGDVGTKPEEVEKYLESVLHLGRIWDCVVLLDEADVFLEQRGLEDLHRNALVSAFLSVIEYFEGILILTTNRVDRFDEAFKSRIQLALHYPPLGEEQRRIIWRTFIQRQNGSSTDISNLVGSLDVLQREKLNGRQIRNAITTARQYAKWKKEVLRYDHLKDVIEVAAKFDEYLENVHRGGHMQV